MRATTLLLRLVRMALIVGLAMALAEVGRAWGGKPGGVIAVGGFALLLIWAFVLLPRGAHRAFEQGDFKKARRRYRILRPLVIDASVRAAIDVSLAGCRLATSDWPGALGELQRIPVARLGPSAKAAWLNNRAYAHARAPMDAQLALKDIEEAMELRPDVAGFRHTKGLALLALGRLDEAIVELDSVWKKMPADEVSPELEAERCFDLAVAWRKKGEGDYARDYLERVVRVAPGSPWAAKAGRELSAMRAGAGAVADQADERLTSL